DSISSIIPLRPPPQFHHSATPTAQATTKGRVLPELQKATRRTPEPNSAHAHNILLRTSILPFGGGGVAPWDATWALCGYGVLALSRRVRDPRDPVERSEKILPDVALAGQRLAAGRRQLVVAAPALAGALDPAALDEAAVFETVERGIERRDVEADGPLG